MGQDVTRVMDLDVLQFNALVDTMTRISYREKEQDAWTALVTSQGSENDLVRMINSWRKAIGGDELKGRKEKGPQDFVKDVNAGKVAGGARGAIRAMQGAGLLGR